MSASIISILQVFFVLLLAPALSWFIKKVKALSQNRVGPSLLQAYCDLIKLLGKEMTVSDTASWLFYLAPYVLFAGTLAASFMVPVFWTGSLLGFMGDAILFVYLLALGKFFIALAALDTGTAFGGMGSSREMTLSSLAEPAFLLSFFSMAFHMKTLSLAGMMSRASMDAPPQVIFFTSLAFGALLIVTIAESARLPVDNPATHLELTMIHEAMVLEYSGKYLALIEWSHQIKQLLLITVLANLFFPWGMGAAPGLPGLLLNLAVYLVKVFGIAFVIGWIEIHFAKLRLFRVPDLLAIAFVLALLSFLAQLMVGR